MTDLDLIEYASKFRRAIIGDASSAWWCAAISAPLCASLCAIGVPVQIVENDLGDCNHVFLRLADGRILDPTADQFNLFNKVVLPGVYLGKPSAIHDGAASYGGQCWDELMREFKRLLPAMGADEVGGMVRMTLATFSAGLVQLPAV